MFSANKNNETSQWPKTHILSQVKMTVFWDVALCSFVEMSKTFL
jgi:hypothetical protein